MSRILSRYVRTGKQQFEKQRELVSIVPAATSLKMRKKSRYVEEDLPSERARYT